jgi:predicted dienelactone hydrolase
MHTIAAPVQTSLITLFITLILLMPTSSYSGEQLFTKQPSVTPELAQSGSYNVGVRTVNVEHPNQLNTSDFVSIANRKLTLEIWYPSSNISSKTSSKISAKTAEPKQVSISKATYQDQTRSGKPFELQGNAYRDTEIDSSLGKFPLIVLSHGYTGYRSMMFYLAEHLASHGYVVASIDHTDSTNREINFSNNPGAGFASTLYNRARDQQFVLDHLNHISSKFSTLIDSTSAAVIGYSMGGYGAINTVGGCYNFSPEYLAGLGFPAESLEMFTKAFNSCSAGRKSVDPRWKAMVALAPWGGEQFVHEAESLANITVPVMLVAGDQDDVSGFEDGVATLFMQIGSKHKYMMVYENARHNIAAHPAPIAAYDNDLDIGHYYEPSWNSETITRINKHMVLAFLDHHVKQNKAAGEYLPTRESATQSKGQDGKLNAPWPGFPDRWAVGLSFVRGE